MTSTAERPEALSQAGTTVAWSAVSKLLPRRPYPGLRPFDGVLSMPVDGLVIALPIRGSEQAPSPLRRAAGLTVLGERRMSLLLTPRQPP